LNVCLIVYLKSVKEKKKILTFTFNMYDTVASFYDVNPFPGRYTIEQYQNYDISSNRYLSFINRYMQDGVNVLDIGCGTGLITNVFAYKYKSTFTGIDVSKTSIEIAKQQNSRAEFQVQDILTYTSNVKYDIILCQSVLNHIPEYEKAVERIKTILASKGVLITGIFNKTGYNMRKMLNLEYSNRVVIEHRYSPYDRTFTHKHFTGLWKEYKLQSVMPSISNNFVNVMNVFNSRNNGLTMYAFKND